MPEKRTSISRIESWKQELKNAKRAPIEKQGYLLNALLGNMSAIAISSLSSPKLKRKAFSLREEVEKAKENLKK